MAQMRIDFQRRGKVQTFSWTCVHPMGNDVQLALGVARQVRTLRQVLTQQPVCILVGPTLPRTMRIGKEDEDRKALVRGHLFAAIIGQRFTQRGGHAPKLPREALACTRGIRPLHPGQQDQASRPLDQGPDIRPVARSLEKVACARLEKWTPSTGVCQASCRVSLRSTFCVPCLCHGAGLRV